MDDFGELLSSVLSDPESMEKIKGIAQSLGMSTDGGQTVTPPEPVAIPSANNMQGGIPFGMMDKIMPLIAAYSRAEADKNVQLLKAIKPYLSSERSEMIDQAIQIMKIMTVLGGEGKNGN